MSMGVQSLDDEELRFFNRRHSSVKAIDSYYILKKYFNNISLDIIYGVPDFTELRRPINVLNSRHTMGIERLRSTLERFIALRPNHISAYALTFEGKTPLQLMADRNRISPVSDEEYKRQGELIFNMLTEAGYERYEVSNFALPGYSSRHNSGYWSGISYLGLGPSASSYDGIRIRRTNPAHLKGYLRHFTEPTSAPFFEEEILSDDELAEERIFLSMRTTKGLDLQMFEIDFGYPRFACLTKGIEKWLKSGDIIVADNYLRFSSQGFWISDYIISELISSW